MITRAKYLSETKASLEQLVSSRQNASDRNEKALQDFFERFPCSLNSTLEGIDSSHNIFGDLIISQPKFKSYDDERQPDFLIVTWNSLNYYFNFIEIEDPSKLMFHKSELRLSVDFLEAYNQLKQWQSYKNNEVKNYCSRLLETLYRDNDNNTLDKVTHINYILVYGFSSEVRERGPRYNHLLQQYFNDDLYHCTYSRLLDNFRMNHSLLCVKRAGSQFQFKAVGLTPFKTYDLERYGQWNRILDKADLIRSSGYFSQEEIAYLIREIQKLDNKSKEQIRELWRNDHGFNITDPKTFDLLDFW